MDSVAIVGLGSAGGFSAKALRAVAPATTILGVDPAGDAAAAAHLVDGRVFHDIGELPSEAGVRLAIVATPTPRHAETIMELLATDRAPEAIWCEKPLSVSHEELDQCWAAADARGDLRTLFHTSFAPEVASAVSRFDTMEKHHGGIVSARCEFSDPYELDPRAMASLGTSWLDSGVNALSVLARFVALNEIVDAAHDPPLACEARLSIGSAAGVATVKTNWTIHGRKKATTLCFRDGATMELAHHRGAVEVRLPSGELIDFQAFGRESLARRYETMLESYLRPDGRRHSRDVDHRIHRLLASVAQSSPREVC